MQLKVILFLRSSAASVVLVAIRSLSETKLLTTQVDLLLPGTPFTHCMFGSYQCSVVCTVQSSKYLLFQRTSVFRATTRIGLSVDVMYLCTFGWEIFSFRLVILVYEIVFTAVLEDLGAFLLRYSNLLLSYTAAFSSSSNTLSRALSFPSSNVLIIFSQFARSNLVSPSQFLSTLGIRFASVASLAEDRSGVVTWPLPALVILHFLLRFCNGFSRVGGKLYIFCFIL